IAPLPVVVNAVPAETLIVPLALAERVLPGASVIGPLNDTALNSLPAEPSVRPAFRPDTTRSLTVRLSLPLPCLMVSVLVGLVNSVYSKEAGVVLSYR